MQVTPEPEHHPYVDAALHCYGLIAALKVDDVDDVEAIERAIDLAISRGRDGEGGEYLIRDVLRNGRFSARRSWARRRRTEARNSQDVPRRITGRRRIPGDAVSLDAAPFEESAAAELEAELLKVARDCGPAGPAILANLSAGNPILEVAGSAGVSRSTADRTIARIRARARELGYPAAA
jgi:hypothetical protein